MSYRLILIARQLALDRDRQPTPGPEMRKSDLGKNELRATLAKKQKSFLDQSELHAGLAKKQKKQTKSKEIHYSWKDLLSLSHIARLT